MQPIAKQRIDDSVYKQLLDNIKSGVWKSGEKIPSENDLCEILQVSRVSVRSAIQRLQSIGVVEVHRGKGTYVCQNEDLFDYSGFSETINLSQDEYKEINELREAIENRAVQILASKAGTFSTELIQKAFDNMCKAAEKLDYKELTYHDLAFHNAIIIASENSRFVQIMRIFQEDYYRVLLETNKLMLRDYPDESKVRQHFQDCLDNHKNLIKALEDKHGDAMSEQDKFLQRNKERMEFFYKKNGNAD